jgi:hypothetical protein
LIFSMSLVSRMGWTVIRECFFGWLGLLIMVAPYMVTVLILTIGYYIYIYLGFKVKEKLSVDVNVTYVVDMYVVMVI